MSVTVYNGLVVGKIILNTIFRRTCTVKQVNRCPSHIKKGSKLLFSGLYRDTFVSVLPLNEASDFW